MTEENQENQENTPKKSDIIFKIVTGIAAATLLLIVAYTAFLWIVKALD